MNQSQNSHPHKEDLNMAVVLQTRCLEIVVLQRTALRGRYRYPEILLIVGVTIIDLSVEYDRYFLPN